MHILSYSHLFVIKNLITIVANCETVTASFRLSYFLLGKGWFSARILVFPLSPHYNWNIIFINPSLMWRRKHAHYGIFGTQCRSV